MASKTILLVAAEKDFLRQRDIPVGLRRVQTEGDCEFCHCKVIFNRQNYDDTKSKGLKPVLICGSCYSQGNHVKQGYGND